MTNEDSFKATTERSIKMAPEFEMEKRKGEVSNETDFVN